MTGHGGIVPWDDEGLSEIANDVAIRRGGAGASAVFAEMEELKFQWIRSGKRTCYKVSDYLRYAPEGVLEDLFSAVADRSLGEQAPYSERAKRWLTEEMKGHELETYLVRHGAHEGIRVDLEALRPKGCTATLRFGPQSRDCGSSYLFDVIIIKDDLDEEGNEEEIAELIAEEQERLEEARGIF